MMNKEIKKYYKEVSTLLPVHGKYEKQFLKNIRESLLEFSADIPDITYLKLCDEFGDPQDIIINYYSEIDNEYLRKQLRRTHFIRIATTVAFILFCALMIYLAVLFYIDFINAQNAIITHEKTIIE